jgi:hypothetical protein
MVKMILIPMSAACILAPGTRPTPRGMAAKLAPTPTLAMTLWSRSKPTLKPAGIRPRHFSAAHNW